MEATAILPRVDHDPNSVHTNSLTWTKSKIKGGRHRMQRRRDWYSCARPPSCRLHGNFMRYLSFVSWSFLFSSLLLFVVVPISRNQSQVWNWQFKILQLWVSKTRKLPFVFFFLFLVNFELKGGIICYYYTIRWRPFFFFFLTFFKQRSKSNMKWNTFACSKYGGF